MSTPGTVLRADIMGNLSLLRYFRTLGAYPYRKPTKFMERKDKTNRILNWVATSFVREAEGDAVATALATSPRGIILYIAANRGKSEPEDVKNMDAFVTVLRNAIRAYRDGNTDDAALLLIDHAISTSTLRLARKLEKIAAMVNECQQTPQTSGAASSEKSGEMFETLVQAWAESPDSPTQDPTLARLFGAIYDTTTVLAPSDMLLKIFHDLTTACDERLQPRACLLAHAMARSQFFESLSASSNACRLAYHGLYWLLRLHRRIRYIGHYLAGAQSLATHGLKMFTETLGPNHNFSTNDPEIIIKWVGDITELPAHHGVPQQWPFSARDRLEQFLSADMPNVSLPPDGSFVSGLDQAFKKGDTIVPHLHCELQLIRHLKEKDIRVHDMAIGVSKLPCTACDVYIDASNKRTYEDDESQACWPDWRFSGASNKFCPDWLMPPEHQERIAEVIQHNLVGVLNGFADEGVVLRERDEVADAKREKEIEFMRRLAAWMLRPESPDENRS